MATLKVIINPRAKKDRTHQVLIRITHLGLDIHLPKKDFNPKATLENGNWVKAGHPLCDIFNQQIEDTVVGLRKVSTTQGRGGACFAQAEKPLFRQR